MGDGTKENPYTREDVLRLIKENGGKAEGLDLSGKTFEQGINLSGLDLKKVILNRTFFPTKLQVSGFRAIEQPAQFVGTNLMQAELKKADLALAQLQGANLMAAELQEAHLLAVNLQGALLRMAQLQDAYLGKAQLQSTELYKTKLEGASLNGARFSVDTELEDADWGNYILGEEKGGLFDWATASYRQLKIWYTNAGIYDVAGKFFYREMEAKRKAQSWKKNPHLKIWNWAMRLLCGYGEKPERVVISAAAIILVAAFVYFFAGLLFEWSAFWSSLYFSAVSFTALGYGSWVSTSSDWIRGLGAAESFLGVFMMALFLVSFIRKMTR